jgi:geranylgeranylglycerol-phosphate geranylgeranyltransferase
MGSFLDYFEIMRPINSLMVGVSIIIGAILTGGINILDNPLLLVFSFLTGFSLTGASMAINDYYDREIDKINEPNRPIPSGRIFPKNVLIFTAILSIIGLVSSLLISRTALSLAGIAWVIMMVYSVWGKQTGFLGNLMVSTCISLPFIYGSILSGETTSSFSFSLLAFLSNTGREITKGIVDMDGDQIDGVNTIAVVYGASRAAYVATLFYIAAVISSIFPLYLNLVSYWYIPFIFITDVGLITYSYQIVVDPSRKTSRIVKNRVLYLMLIGLIGFLAGSKVLG